MPSQADEKSHCLTNLLVHHPSGELRKQLPREIASFDWVADMFAAKIVVENSAVDGLVDMGQAEIHVIACNGTGHTTDEDHGAIRFLPFDDADVRERIVHLTVPVVVPCIVEEDEIARVDNRSLVKRALLPYVLMDDPDAVGVRIARFAVIKVDPMFEKHRPCHPGAVIGDASAVALNRVGAYEFGRCSHDRFPARCAFDRSTARLRVRCRCARAFA